KHSPQSGGHFLAAAAVVDRHEQLVCAPVDRLDAERLPPDGDGLTGDSPMMGDRLVGLAPDRPGQAAIYDQVGRAAPLWFPSDWPRDRGSRDSRDDHLAAHFVLNHGTVAEPGRAV